MIIGITYEGKEEHAAGISSYDIMELMEAGNFAIYKAKWGLKHERGRPSTGIFIANHPDEVAACEYCIRKKRIRPPPLDTNSSLFKLSPAFARSVSQNYYQCNKPTSIKKITAPYIKPYQWEKRFIKLLELLDVEEGSGMFKTFEEIKSKIGFSSGVVNRLLNKYPQKGEVPYFTPLVEVNQLKDNHKLVLSITDDGRRRLAFMKLVYGC